MIEKVLKSMAVLLMVLLPMGQTIQNVKAVTSVSITVHYQRSDASYTGWNLWLWPEGSEGKAYDLGAVSDDFGKVTVVSIETTATTFGFIMRLNDWEQKDIGSDRFFDLNAGKAEIWLKQGDTTVYTSKPSTNSTPLPALGEISLKVHYHRYDNVYSGWNMWLWQAGFEGSGNPFNGSDSFGAVLNINIKPEKGINDLGFLLRLNEWAAKDIDTDRLINLTRQKNNKLEVWLVQGDTRIYYKLSDIDMSPKFLSANLDGPDFISVKTTVPIELKDTKLQGLTLKNSVGEVIPTRFVLISEGAAATNSSKFTLFTQDPLNLMETYTLSHKGYTDTQVQFNSVFKSEGFEKAFNTTSELGAMYTSTSTIFRLWAPTASKVKINFFTSGDGTTGLFPTDKEDASLELVRVNNGVWELEVGGEFKSDVLHLQCHCQWGHSRSGRSLRKSCWGQLEKSHGCRFKSNRS